MNKGEKKQSYTSCEKERNAKKKKKKARTLCVTLWYLSIKHMGMLLERSKSV
jgi:hypothetical protein